MRRFLVGLLVVMAPALAQANEAHDALVKMTDLQRNYAFAKFMEASGERCPQVTRNMFQGFDKKKNAFWSLTCDNGQSWSVMIYNDAKGSSRILECSVLKAVGGGQCFKKF